MTAREGGGHALAFAVLAAVVFSSHAAYLTLPYFWDELGQFVPAALDIARDGAWIPHSTVPNSHPPATMAYLAAVWNVFGYSIAATRAAMLVLASALAYATFLLAIRLCRGTAGAPAFLAVLFLLADPLFYTQGMMAQLDLPAALFTVLALLLYLDGRFAAAAAVCVLLVLTKETAAVLPAVFAVDRFRAGRWRETAWFCAPFAALGVWFFALWRATGHLFGDSGYTHYNLTYPLHPVRIVTASLRRFYDLFIADFRWIGAIALWFALRRTRLFATREWRLTGAAALAQTLLVTVLGGAALERYLLPVLPLLYIAFAAAGTVFRPAWRGAGAIVLTAGLIAGWFVNPPFPFPYENNLAMADFVRLHRSAAAFLETNFPGGVVYTAWPLTAALRRPEFGYVTRALRTRETSDLRASTLEALAGENAGILVVYSRTWDPPWGVLRISWVRRFLSAYYDYAPEIGEERVWRVFHLKLVARWERRGQWIEVYARPGAAAAGSEAGRSGERLDRFIELGGLKRLGDISVHAGVEALLTVAGQGAGGHGENGGVASRFSIPEADEARRFETVHAGHLNVHENDVEGLGGMKIDRFFPAPGLYHAMALPLEKR